MNDRLRGLPAFALDDQPAPADAIGAARPPDAHRNGHTFPLPPHGLVFEDLERDLVRQALERTGGNQTQAARLLGMTRDQIRYRIRKFDLALRPESASAA
jgi:transcriptional regulator with GAF, ATPase, and Fis domain